MARFNVIGKEMRIRPVKPHGTGAIIYVPRDWLNEKVAVINGVESEVDNLSKTNACLDIRGEKNLAVHAEFADDVEAIYMFGLQGGFTILTSSFFS